MSPENVPLQADFGRALRHLRAVKGLTQEDLLLATSRRHMSRIEQGHQQPSIQTVENLAAALRIHPLTLLVAAYCPGVDSKSVQSLLQAIERDLGDLATR